MWLTLIWRVVVMYSVGFRCILTYFSFVQKYPCYYQGDNHQQQQYNHYNERNTPCATSLRCCNNNNYYLGRLQNCAVQFTLHTWVRFCHQTQRIQLSGICCQMFHGAFVKYICFVNFGIVNCKEKVVAGHIFLCCCGDIVMNTVQIEVIRMCRLAIPRQGKCMRLFRVVLLIVHEFNRRRQQVSI